MLIVVAIIAALTSFAVPQYKKTIVKARMAEVYTMMDTIRKACALSGAEGKDIGPWSPRNASWELSIPEPSYPDFKPTMINCTEVWWSSGVLDNYICTLNAKTGKFCCPDTDGSFDDPGFTRREATQFFVKSMAQRYHSCD